MGKRGPPKQPKEVLEARGSWRADWRTTVEMPEGIPRPPQELEPYALDAWIYIVPIMEAAHLLRLSDQKSLARYCNLLARYDQANKELNKSDSLLVIAGDGYKVNPLMTTILRLSDALIKYEDRFGLNPSARANVCANADVPKTDFNKSQFFA